MTIVEATSDRYTYDLPAALEASEPPEARGLTRDAVRMLVAYREHRRRSFPAPSSSYRSSSSRVTSWSSTPRARFRLPSTAIDDDGNALVVHLSTQLDDIEVGGRAPPSGGPHHRAVGRPAATEAAPPSGMERCSLSRSPTGRNRGCGWPHLELGQRTAQLAGSTWSSYSLRLCREALAHRDVPERLRHRARERRDAQCRPALHPRSDHAPGGQGSRHRPPRAPHRGRFLGDRRASLSGAGHGACSDGGAGQRRPSRPAVESSLLAPPWFAASRPRSERTATLTPTTGGPTWSSRRREGFGSSTE